MTARNREAVVGIVTLDEFVLIGRRLFKPEANKLELPGGKIEPIDENTLETIRREFGEELPHNTVDGWVAAFSKTLMGVGGNPWNITYFIGEIDEIPPFTGPAHHDIQLIDEEGLKKIPAGDFAFNHHAIL